MYMSVCYNGIRGFNWKFPANQSPALLMQWHLEDTVSNFEIARHEYIFSQQKNRNPFIDNPDWYSRINFSNMTYITTGVEKIDFTRSIATYPNPAAEKISVDATLIFTTALDYEICDTKGAVIKDGQLLNPQSEIDMPANAGMYFLRLKTDNGIVVAKLIRK